MRLFFIINLFISILSFSQKEQAIKELDCTIDLSQINLNMNVENFFLENFINKDSLLYQVEDKQINAKEYFAKYNKTYTIARNELTKKSINKSNYGADDDSLGIGKLYVLNRYSESDKLACFQNISFYTIDVLASTNDEFVALMAYNRKVNENDFNALIKKLNDEYKVEISLFKGYKEYKYKAVNKNISLNVMNSSASIVSEPSFGNKSEAPKYINVEIIILSTSANDNHIKWLKYRHND